MNPTAPSESDPMPEPPVPPELEDCCGSGCPNCVFDLHDLGMERYRQAFRAWRARHPDTPAAEGREGRGERP